MCLVLRWLAALLVCGSSAGVHAQATFVESATLTHDGLLRYFDYYLPDGLSSDPVALLFVLHGGTGSNDSMQSGTIESKRNDGWGLFGLWQSLEAQGKTEEAREIRQAYDKAWKDADVELTHSRF